MDYLPPQETQNRIQKIRHYIANNYPELSGIFIFSRISIYYFTGTLANGVLWIPLENEPILFVRKGLERAKKESSLTHIYPYKSYSEIEKICHELNMSIAENWQLGIETTGITYQLAQLFFSKIKAFQNSKPYPIDDAIKYIRSIKSEYEAKFMREAGKRQALALEKILPFAIQEYLEKGEQTYSYLKNFDENLLTAYPQEKELTEKKIAEICIAIYTELEHGKMCRMSAHGEESFYGHVALGNSLNTAHYYNGAMGFQGLHPALPCLGSNTLLTKNTPLCVDMLFNYKGYNTDKTQCYFYGKEKDLPDIAKKALDFCIEIQDMVINTLKQGSIPEEIWFNTLEKVKQYHFEENFMGYKQNSVPFLGHGIGLTVDENPVLAKNFKEPLENGMFIACEPKIGIPNFGMIGIENTFELIDNSVKNITSLGNNIIYLA